MAKKPDKKIARMVDAGELLDEPVHLRLSNTGRVIVPARWRNHLGWHTGDNLVIRVADGVVLVSKPVQSEK